MGTSTVQLLQDDMLEKPEEQPPMSTDGHDVTATASLNQPLPILQCVPLPLTDIQVMTQSPPPEKTSCQNSSGKENTLEKPPKVNRSKIKTCFRPCQSMVRKISTGTGTACNFYTCLLKSVRLTIESVSAAMFNIVYFCFPHFMLEHSCQSINMITAWNYCDFF